jgi:hypothetical protein
MNVKEFPACLWFPNQKCLSIWDAEEVLDALQNALPDESMKRNPPKETHHLGFVDIYCATLEKSREIRKIYEKLRGTV